MINQSASNYELLADFPSIKKYMLICMRKSIRLNIFYFSELNQILKYVV